MMKNELERRIAELEPDAPLNEILKVINEWEKWAVKEFRKQENTKHSGILITV